MILISHRGNLNGKDLTLENSPQQIEYCLNENFNVEIDVNFFKNKIYLGHDEPQYEIQQTFLKKEGLWCHAKDIESLHLLLKINTNCFSHNIDNAVLTSKGFIWTFPGNKLTSKSICVLPEKSNYKKNELLIAAGICTDYIFNYRNLINENTK